eukprot:CAMPEP_0172196526 /NCGR_PEP_ID=MMETSP1050-20130122/26882_1 /TAXON_ID=233186 /ORGANISM="Cryptomonas curvata, Strain CCAP979/52" /LENGTH=71 /DNA_ID=CAMNT_0012872849 /DNA_START=61 /DNA_END=272 /DNA_ORIENTATION=+
METQTYKDYLSSNSELRVMAQNWLNQAAAQGRFSAKIQEIIRAFQEHLIEARRAIGTTAAMITASVIAMMA